MDCQPSDSDLNSYEEYPTLISPVCEEGNYLESPPQLLLDLLDPCLASPADEELSDSPVLRGRTSRNGRNHRGPPVSGNSVCDYTRRRQSKKKAQEKLRQRSRSVARKIKDDLSFFSRKFRKCDLRTQVLRLHRRYLKEQPIEGIAKTPLKYIRDYLDNPPLCDQRNTSVETTAKFLTYNADYCKHFLGMAHRRPVLKSYYNFLNELFEEQDPLQLLGLSCPCDAEHSKDCAMMRNDLKKQLRSDAFLFT